jgi:hypothetical protein
VVVVERRDFLFGIPDQRRATIKLPTSTAAIVLPGTLADVCSLIALQIRACVLLTETSTLYWLYKVKRYWEVYTKKVDKHRRNRTSIYTTIVSTANLEHNLLALCMYTREQQRPFQSFSLDLPAHYHRSLGPLLRCTCTTLTLTPDPPTASSIPSLILSATLTLRCVP